MSAVSPAGVEAERLRRKVQAIYSRVATGTDTAFHFHTGPQYAVDLLRYDAAELDALPTVATASFAGVGNPLRVGPVPFGAVVLDHACGSGTDLLLAARRIGPEGRAIGVDMTPAMLVAAQRAAREADLEDRVELRPGLFEELPVERAGVDIVLSNGVLNLAPDKPRVMREIARVLRPGGRLYLADVVVERGFSWAARNDPDLWAGRVAGAVTEPELVALVSGAGLGAVRIVESFDCFRRTSLEQRFGRALLVRASTLLAVKR
jgi:SAM-dependent methyltransferase